MDIHKIGSWRSTGRGGREKTGFPDLTGSSFETRSALQGPLWSRRQRDGPA
jgi:hypothetical protein